MKILVVDDEKKIADLIAKGLKAENFNVDVVYDGEKAIEAALCNEYDIILLDYLLPKKNGKKVLETIRKHDRPSKVIMLTAIDAIADKVDLLNAGADDYIVKPFNFEELLVRVRVQVRILTSTTTNILQANNIRLNSQSHIVTVEDKPIYLSAREFDLLEYLMQHKNILVPRTKLWEHVWDMPSNTYSNVVDVYVCYIRNKIDDGEGTNKNLIQSVRGKGYILRCEN